MNGLRQLWQWFMALETRERRVLAAGVISLGIFVLYVAIVSPYVHYRQALNTELQNQRNLLAWMHPAAQQLESSHAGQRAALPGGSLLSAINSSVAGSGLGTSLQQAQTTSDGGVRMQFSGVNFDGLVRWLAMLQQTYGIAASDATFTRAAEPGLVDANLELRTPAQ